MIFSVHPFCLILVLTIYLIITNEMNSNSTEIQILRIINDKKIRKIILVNIIYLRIYLFSYLLMFLLLLFCFRLYRPL